MIRAMDTHLRAIRTCLGGAMAGVFLCHVVGFPRGEWPDAAYAACGFLACAALVRSARPGTGRGRG